MVGRGRVRHLALALSLSVLGCGADRPANTDPLPLASRTAAAGHAVRVLASATPFAGCPPSQSLGPVTTRLGTSVLARPLALTFGSGAVFEIAETREEGELLYILDDVQNGTRECVVLWPAPNGWTGTYRLYHLVPVTVGARTCVIEADLVITR